MKTVMNSSMVEHVWANQSQYEARTSNGNFWFRDKALYSFRTPIANFVEGKVNGKKQRICLITSVSYSIITSSKHMPSSSNIPPGIPVFRVEHIGISEGRAPSLPKDWKAANLRILIEAYEIELKKLARSRSHTEWRIDSLERMRGEAQAYAKAFGLRFNPAKFPAPTKEAIEAAKARGLKAQQAATKRTIAEKKKQAKYIAEHYKAFVKDETSNGLDWRWWNQASDAQKSEARNILIDRWRASKIDRMNLHYGMSHSGGGAALRVNGENVETSQGAQFPIEHAKKAFTFVRAARDNKRAWKANGHTIKLGHFAIDSIAENGDVSAGCHFVEWAEIEACARTLKIFP